MTSRRLHHWIRTIWRPARHHNASMPWRQRLPKLQLMYLESRIAPALSEMLGAVPGITSSSSPPDTVMDVGPNHIVQMVNATRYQVWDKHGNALTGPLNFGSLFPVGSPIRNNSGDPIVVYDHLADRWVLSQFGNPTYLGFAVSRTPDPVGGVDGIANNGDEWFTFTFNVGDFPDYPKIGVWHDAYYVTSYESPNLGIYAFNRIKMLAGDTSANFVKTTLPIAATTGGYRDTRIIPVDLDGPAPAAGTPGYFVRTVDSNQDAAVPQDRIEVYSATPNFTAGTIAFTLIQDIRIADGLLPFNTMRGNRNGQGVRDMIPQPGTLDTVDSLSNRPMMQLKFRNFGTHFSMVFNQTVDVQNFIQAETGFNPALEVAGIRWYELRSVNGGMNWSIFQQGDFSPQIAGLSAENQLLHRWMGSAAIDADGNIAIGYSICNSDNANPVFPGMRYAGRRAGDPLGQLTQGEQIIFNGTTFSGDTDGNVEPRRWGDYAALSVDPTDDHKFWFTTHAAGGVTRVAAFFVAVSPPGFQFQNGVLTIIADQLNPTRGDDILLMPDPSDPTDFLVFLNGTGPIPDFRIPFAQLTQLIVRSGGGDDTIRFDSNGDAAGGNVDFISFPVSVDGGGDPGDQLVLQAVDHAADFRVTVTTTAIGADAAGGDNFFAPGGSMSYAGLAFLTISAGSGNNAYIIRGTGATDTTTIDDGEGDSTFAISGDALTGSNAFNGHGGADHFSIEAGAGITGTALDLTGGDSQPGMLETISFDGLATDESAELHFGFGVLGQQLIGLGTTVRFDTLEVVSYDGLGGNNQFSLIDDSGFSYGTAAFPRNGFIYRPTGPGAGDIRTNAQLTQSDTPDVFFSNVNLGLTINGDGDGSGDVDFLTVLGLSTNGNASGTYFAEGVSANGVDTILVSDSSVSITNTDLGQLTPLTLGETGGLPTFTGVYIRTGNEPGPGGDKVTAQPSARMDIFIDGMGPAGTRPGDRIDVPVVGAQSFISIDSAPLGPHIQIVQNDDGASVHFRNFESIPNAAFVATGAGSGGGPHVRVLDPKTLTLRLTAGGAPLFDFYAFDPKFTGGVRVASGDITGDSIPDLVVAAGPGGGPHVKAFNGLTGAQLFSFYAYSASFSGGVFVAVGDTNGDGRGDIITGAGAGGGPHVKVFSGLDGSLLNEYFAYNAGFQGGVTVAAGDTDGDGVTDIITGAGGGGGPHVTVRRGTDLELLASFFAFDTPLLGGVFVAGGDVDGDFIADIVVGAGSGGPPVVRAFRGLDQALIASFNVNEAFAPNTVAVIPRDSGVHVALADVNDDGLLDIVTGKGTGNRPRVRSFSLAGGPAAVQDALVYNDDFAGGIFVGA